MSKYQQALDDPRLLTKKAKQAGVKVDLLKMEYELIIQINEAKKQQDHPKIKELTAELIVIQKQQPEVGAIFG